MRCQLVAATSYNIFRYTPRHGGYLPLSLRELTSRLRSVRLEHTHIIMCTFTCRLGMFLCLPGAAFIYLFVGIIETSIISMEESVSVAASTVHRNSGTDRFVVDIFPQVKVKKQSAL